jgi:glycosyltransferase involved in cell wall biosynthesis
MSREDPTPVLSVVVPVYDEEETLQAFYDRLRAAIDALGEPAEIVFVNDGSSDRTAEVLAGLQAGDDRIVVVDLSRNFGHQAALTAGIDVARGDAVLTMDADLEHPPEAIPLFVERWRGGEEVVSGVRREAQRAGLFKRVTSNLFYWLFGRVSDVAIGRDSPDFRLMDRGAADALRSMRERARFLRGMARWIGFRQGSVPFDPGTRAGGETGYSLVKMVRFGADGLLSFSKAPIRLTTVTGLAVSVSAFLYAGYALYQHLVAGQTVPGWTSTVVVLSLLAGFNLLALGMIGEYVGMVYDEVKQRPIYVVREVGRAGRAPSADEGAPPPEKE